MGLMPPEEQATGLAPPNETGSETPGTGIHQKVGPLEVWQWGVIVVGGIALWYWYSHRESKEGITPQEEEKLLGGMGELERMRREAEREAHEQGGGGAGSGGGGGGSGGGGSTGTSTGNGTNSTGSGTEEPQAPGPPVTINNPPLDFTPLVTAVVQGDKEIIAALHAANNPQTGTTVAANPKGPMFTSGMVQVPAGNPGLKWGDAYREATLHGIKGRLYYKPNGTTHFVAASEYQHPANAKARGTPGSKNVGHNKPTPAKNRIKTGPGVTQSKGTGGTKAPAKTNPATTTKRGAERQNRQPKKKATR